MGINEHCQVHSFPLGKGHDVVLVGKFKHHVHDLMGRVKKRRACERHMVVHCKWMVVRSMHFEVVPHTGYPGTVGKHRWMHTVAFDLYPNTPSETLSNKFRTGWIGQERMLHSV